MDASVPGTGPSRAPVNFQTNDVTPETARFFIETNDIVIKEPRIAEKVNGVLQFIIKKGGGDWIVDLRPASVSIARGRFSGANATLTYANESIFHNINSNKSSVNKEILLGRFKVSGDLKMLGRMMKAVKQYKEEREAEAARSQAQAVDLEAAARRPLYRQPSTATGASLVSSPPVWVSDEQASHCTKCRSGFTFMRRRHHCRMCGRIFCNSCSSHQHRGNRVCDLCYHQRIRRPRPRSSSVLSQSQTTASQQPAPTPRTLSVQAPPMQSTLSASNSSVSLAPMPTTPSREIVPQRITPAPAASVAVTEVEDGAEVDESGDSSAPMILRVQELEDNLKELEAQLIVASSLSGQAPTPSQITHDSALLGALLTFGLLVYAKLGPKLFPAFLLYYAVTGYFSGSLWFGWFSALVYIGCAVFILYAMRAEPMAYLRRRLTVLGLMFVVWGDYRMVRWQTDKLDDEESQPIWDQAHQRNGVRIQRLCLELQGFWLKLGQYMSSRNDACPPQYIQLLSKLQDGARVHSGEETRALIESELGKPADELFASIDDAPLASASIGQVHRATLLDGRRVALKVQHPGVVERIEMDLLTLSFLLKFLSYAEPSLDHAKFINEWSKELEKELNFEHEATNLRTVGAHIRDSGLPVILPRVIEGFVSRRVLAMEFIQGESVNDLAHLRRLGVNIESLVKNVVQAIGYQVYVTGVFNGDCHPGNIMIAQKRNLDLSGYPEGSDPFANHLDTDWVPVLIDYGCTKNLSTSIRLSFATLAVSAETLDYGGILNAMKLMGMVVDGESIAQDMHNFSYSLRSSKPGKQARKEFKEHMDKKKELNDANTSRKVRSMPGEILFYFRCQELVQGLCSRLASRIPVGATMTAFARTALLNRYSVEDRMQVPVFPYRGANVNTALDDRVRRLLKHLVEAEAVLGLQVCIVQGASTIAVDVAAGQMGTFDLRPVRPSSLFPTFGVARLSAITVVHQLATNGTVNYDDHVQQHWPEFGVNGKQGCTVAALMRCQSGVEAALPASLATTSFREGNLTDVTSVIAEAPPSLLPSATKPTADFQRFKDVPPADRCGPGPLAENVAHLYYGWSGAVLGLLSGASNVSARSALSSYMNTNLRSCKDEFIMGLPEEESSSDSIATVKLSQVEADVAGFDYESSQSSTPGSAPVRSSASHASGAGAGVGAGAGAGAGAGSGSGGGKEEETEDQDGSTGMSAVTMETALAALEFGRVLTSHGLEDLSSLTKAGAEHMMDPRIMNNFNVRSCVCPSSFVFASARALAQVTAAISDDLLKQSLDAAASPTPGALPPHTSAVHSACSNLGFRPFVFSQAASSGVVASPPSTPGRGGAGATAGGLEPRLESEAVIGFGLSGLGGTTVVSIPSKSITIAVTVNQLTPERRAVQELVSQLASMVGVGPMVIPTERED